MAKFRVAPERAPGIYRQGIGFFKPGAEIHLPDEMSQPGEPLPSGLIPLDKEAEKLLKESDAQKAALKKERSDAEYARIAAVNALGSIEAGSVTPPVTAVEAEALRKSAQQAADEVKKLKAELAKLQKGS